MSNNNVTVMAQVRVKKSLEKNVREELMKLVTPTRSEPGCIVYDLYQEADSSSHFMFYECWKSKKDLDEHLQKPYIKAFMETADEMLEEPVKVSLWEKLSEK
jgi:quinol monooxygenase YgiN